MMNIMSKTFTVLSKSVFICEGYIYIYIIPLLVFRFRYFWLSVTVGICFIKKVFFGPEDCCVQNDYYDVKGHSYPDRGQGQSLSPGGARSTTIHIPTIIITPRL